MREIRFNISDTLADKFELAVQLTGGNRDQLAEEFIKSYLAKALQSAADEFRQPEQAAQSTRSTAPPPPPSRPEPPRGVPNHERPPRENTWNEWGKANQRIPRWARNPQQNNHKILRAFFELQKEMKAVTIDALRRRCSDPVGHPDTYVPHFDNNFSQMKFDHGHSHGKVFEERNGFINVWDHISDTLQRYRDYFSD
jgi:hypothetical protein